MTYRNQLAEVLADTDQAQRAGPPGTRPHRQQDQAHDQARTLHAARSVVLGLIVWLTDHVRDIVPWRPAETSCASGAHDAVLIVLEHYPFQRCFDGVLFARIDAQFCEV